MKKFFIKAGIAIAVCLFFTIIVPILLTSAQNNLFAFGFGVMFVFFSLCLYLLMTSTFFNTGKPAAEPGIVENHGATAENAS
jgi:hypothetical protein